MDEQDRPRRRQFRTYLCTRWGRTFDVRLNASGFPTQGDFRDAFFWGPSSNGKLNRRRQPFQPRLSVIAST
jgi:hypothetical protein